MPRALSLRTPDGVGLVGEVRGDGVPVVLVMGLGMPGRIWSDVRTVLLPEHSVLTWDHRGIGESDLPESPYRMVDLGDDVGRVLDAAGWDSAHVVGVSMGGMAVQEFAIGHRDRVRSLTLIATHSGSLGAVVPRPEGLLRVLQSRVGRRDRRGAALTKLLFPADSGVTEEDSAAVRQMIWGASDPKHKRALRLQLRAVLGHRTTDRLDQLAGLSTLVVRPDCDLLCRPSNNDRLAQAIPGAVLRRFPGVGHGIVGQAPVELAELIAAHVRRVEG